MSTVSLKSRRQATHDNAFAHAQTETYPSKIRHVIMEKLPLANVWVLVDGKDVLYSKQNIHKARSSAVWASSQDIGWWTKLTNKTRRPFRAGNNASSRGQARGTADA